MRYRLSATIVIILVLGSFVAETQVNVDPPVPLGMWLYALPAAVIFALLSVACLVLNRVTAFKTFLAFSLVSWVALILVTWAGRAEVWAQWIR